MDIKFEKTIGLTKFTFNVQAEGIKDFFEKVSVYEDLPVAGPNGETDLTIAFRTTKQNHKYYSVVCKSAKQEFKFGQSLDGLTMFPKGWEPLYEGEANQQAPGGGLAAQQQYAQNNVQQPGLGQQNINQNVEPQPQYTQPAQAPQPAMPQPAQQNVTTTMNTQQQAPAAPVAPAAGNPAVNDVLAKYGIGQ